MTDNISIHPRVYWGGPKVNTCRAPAPGRRERVIAAIEAHLKRHPNDVMSRARVQKLRDKAA